MKLYTTTRAPNPRRVHLFLAAKGILPEQIGLEVIQVDLSSGQNRTDEYKAIHPMGQLPALQLDSGLVISDSMAICRYLDGVQPEPNLFGEGFEQQAVIDQMSRQAEIEVLIPMMLAFQHGHPFWSGKVEQLADYAPISRRRALARFAYFEQCLIEHDYLAYDRLTVADLTLYAGLDFGRLAGLKIDDKHPHLLAFYQRMHERFAAV